jgi:Tol biopolymer transport system component
MTREMGKKRHPQGSAGDFRTTLFLFLTFWSLPCLAGPEADRLSREVRSMGWIACSAANRAGNWDLWIMRPDGSNRRQITRTRDLHETGVRFSPDGKRMLYYRQPATEPVDNNTYGSSELVIANADGSNPVVMGTNFAWASWGPDSQHISCLSRAGIKVCEIATWKVVRQFPRRDIVSQLVWSPDGRLWVGTANGLGPYWNIGVLNPDSGRITAISETERYNCTPDWCPDSRHVLYARGIIPQQPGHAELWVGDVQSPKARPLYAEQGSHIYGACASPDGKYILFSRSREDLGIVGEISLSIIRWPDQSSSPAEARPERLNLGPGWEPHWMLSAGIPEVTSGQEP